MTDRPKTATHPGLDGLRGLAVVAVLLYHSGFTWAEGGYLGVSVFFTLSGFLITSLLLGERERTGSISLNAFWRRRFRRLIPASITALAGVCVFGATVATAEQRADLAGDVIAALVGVANWRFILQDISYGDLFAGPSPVLHFWSLAIEMQFYVVFPPLVLGALALGRGRRWPVAVLVALLSISSIAATLLLGTSNLDRIYFGTGTRAVELLAGGLLAVAVASWGRPTGRVWGSVSTATGIVAVAVLGYACSTVAQSSEWLYRGGFALIAAVSTVAVLSLARTSRWGATVGAEPMRWLGLRSYGIYLYHWPLFLWLTAERTGLDPWPLLGLRLAVTFAAAELSYRLIESPFRRRSIPKVGVRILGPVATGALVAVALFLSATAPEPALVFRTEVPDAPEVAVAADPEALVVVGGELAGRLATSLDAVADPTVTEVVDRTVDVCVPTGAPRTGILPCTMVERIWTNGVDEAASVVFLVGPGDPLATDRDALERVRAAVPDDAEVTWVTHPLVGPWATSDPARQPQPAFGVAATDDAIAAADASRTMVADIAEASGDELIDLARNLEPPPVGDPPARVPAVLDADDPMVVEGLDATAQEILVGATSGPSSLRILFVGDSIAQTMAAGFEQWGQDSGHAVVWDVTRPGCSWVAAGASELPSSQSEGCLGWDEDFPSYVAEFDPDIVLVEQGTWDLVGRKFDGDQDYREPSDPEFSAAIDQTYRSVLDILQAGGATVLWFNLPCLGPQQSVLQHLDEVRVVHDAILEDIAADRDGVEIYDLESVTCPGGVYEPELGGIPGSRPDEIHFSTEAAYWLAGQVAPTIEELTGTTLTDAG